MPGDSSETALRNTKPTTQQFMYRASMPRPGQQGALIFNGKYVSRFIEEWEEECNEYGIDDTSKAKKLPRYCTPDIRETVETFQSWDDLDWIKMKEELMDEYRKYDETKYTKATLSALCHGSNMDIKNYTRKFRKIAKQLLEHRKISTTERSEMYVRGLPRATIRKVIVYMNTHKKTFNGKLSEEPDFEWLVDYANSCSLGDELLQDFLDEENEEEQPSATDFGDIQRVPPPVIAIASDAINKKTSFVTPPVPSIPKKTAPKSELERMEEMMERLTLALAAQQEPTTGTRRQQPQQPQQKFMQTVRPLIPQTTGDSVYTQGGTAICIYCSKEGHVKRNCITLQNDLKEGLCKLDHKGFVLDKDGRQVSPDARHGIRHSLINTKPESKSYQVESTLPSVSNAPTVTFDEDAYNDNMASARAFNDSASDKYLTEEDFRNEFADVLAAEKLAQRKSFNPYARPTKSTGSDRNDRTLEREILRKRQEEEQLPKPSMAPPKNVMDIPRSESPMQDVEEALNDERQAREQITKDILKDAKPIRYRMAVPVKEATTVEDVGAKILASSVTLPLQDVLATSTELRKHLEQLIRSKRTPIVELDATRPTQEVNVNEQHQDTEEPIYLTPDPTMVLDRAVSMISDNTMYAVASPTVLGKVAGQKVRFLLDSGSEICVMPYRTFERLGIPIDDQVKWTMNNVDYNPSRLLGVCHDVEVNIGGIVVNTHIFVNERSNFDVLLGRPWERAARANYENTDHGSLICRITSGQRSATFTAVEANHPRNKATARRTTISAYTDTVEALSATLTATLEPDSLSLLYGGMSCKQQHAFVRTLYKSVARKIRPINKALPEGNTPVVQDRKVRRRPKVEPGTRVTPERLAAMKIGNGNLTLQEVKMFQDLVMEFEDIFAWTDDEKGQLAAHIEDEHSFTTIEHKPWAYPNIRMTREMEELSVKLLRKKLAAGTLEYGCGPYRNRWFLVPKKNGDGRLILDAQPMNKVMYKDAGMPPNVDEFSETFAGVPIASLGDLFSGYDQWPLAKHLRDMTAMMTVLGLLRYTTMPMGASNAVATFQRGMCRILGDLIPEYARVFIDDVGIKGPMQTYDNKEMAGQPGIRQYVYEHCQILRKVFERIYDAELTFSGEKIWIGMPGINVVGFVCDQNGRHPEAAKIQKVKDWPTPKSITEVRAFMGLVVFYRIFIQDLAQIAAPLYGLMKKNVDFRWNDEHQEAFALLKEALTTDPVVKTIDSPGLTGPPILTFDGCTSVGWGAVLGQDDTNGSRHACRYESGIWSDVELRYDALKLEFCGFVKALKKFKIWLHGRYFLVETDARTLIWMINQIPQDMPNAQITRMLVYIRLFDFDIKHVAGKSNLVADALSRRGATKNDLPDPETIDNIVQLYRYSYDEDPEHYSFSRIFLKEDLYDNYFTAIGQYLTTLERPANMDNKEFKRFKNEAFKYLVKDGILYRKQSDGEAPAAVICKYDIKQKILHALHEECGHRGRDAVFEKMKKRFYWKSMYNDIREHVQTCEPCQYFSARRYDQPLHPTHSTQLFEKISLDVVHLPKSNGKKYLVLARCDLSGYPEGRALTNNTAEAIARFVYEDIICRYGCPRKILTDNGSENQGELDALLKTLGIKHVLISPYHSQANGMIERGHQPIIKALGKYSERDSDWTQHLTKALWADRVTVRRTTRMTPFKLIYGQEAVLPIEYDFDSWQALDWTQDMTTEDLLLNRMRQLEGKDALIQQAARLSQASREQNKEYFDIHMRHRPDNASLEVDDMVLVYDSANDKSWSTSIKLNNRWLGPYKIFKVEDNGSYRLKELDNTKLFGTVSGDRLKKFKPRPVVGQTEDLLVLDSVQNEDHEDSNMDESDEDRIAGQQHVSAPPESLSQGTNTGRQLVPKLTETCIAKDAPGIKVIDTYQVNTCACKFQEPQQTTQDDMLDGCLYMKNVQHRLLQTDTLTILSTLPRTYGDLTQWLLLAHTFQQRLRNFVPLSKPLELLATLGNANTVIPWTQRLGRIFRTLQRQILMEWADEQTTLGDLSHLMAMADLSVAEDQQLLASMDITIGLRQLKAT